MVINDQSLALIINTSHIHHRDWYHGKSLEAGAEMSLHLIRQQRLFRCDPFVSALSEALLDFLVFVFEMSHLVRQRGCLDVTLLCPNPL